MSYPDIGRAPSPDFANRMQHAVDYAVIKQNMIAAGIPKDLAATYANIYRTEQLEYEALPEARQSALEKAHNSPRWRLAGYLNGLVVADLPHFVGPEECIVILPLTYVTPYRLVLVPKSGRIWVITDFSFRYCQLRFTDPYLRSQCDEWEEVLEGQDRTLVGKYRYSAEWPGKPPRRARLNLTYVGAAVRKIIIRRPSN